MTDAVFGQTKLRKANIKISYEIIPNTMIVESVGYKLNFVTLSYGKSRVGITTVDA
jgi:hypothetical protein